MVKGAPTLDYLALRLQEIDDLLADCVMAGHVANHAAQKLLGSLEELKRRTMGASLTADHIAEIQPKPAARKPARAARKAGRK